MVRYKACLRESNGSTNPDHKASFYLFFCWVGTWSGGLGVDGWRLPEIFNPTSKERFVQIANSLCQWLLIPPRTEGWPTMTWQPWTMAKPGRLFKRSLFHGWPSRKLTVRPLKMVVGILLSFWDGPFSGAMLNFGSVSKIMFMSS